MIINEVEETIDDKRSYLSLHNIDIFSFSGGKNNAKMQLRQGLEIV
jgi:hypothetical protein